MHNWQDLELDLKDLRQKNLYRSLTPISAQAGSRLWIGKKSFINFSSNNYLGLATHPAVAQKAIQAIRRWGTGSGASRLISGNLKIHTDLENELARFKAEEAATVFSSGYLANLGVVTALLNEKDLVLVDRLNHASLIDAARFSKAKLWVYPHKDVEALEKLLQKGSVFRKRMVLTDAYFSMDGDVAPLKDLLAVCRKYNAILMIDEAHSTGVYGKKGRGLTEHFGLLGRVDIVMGTLSKALGSVGGFIAGSAVLKEYLTNRSREFIYTTAPSPAASAAAMESLNIIKKTPEIRRRLWANIAYVRGGLKELGFDLMDSEGPVIPIVIGDTKKTLLLREMLKTQGIFAPAVRPPTVPKNTDRIRLSLMANHTKEELDKLLSVLKKARKSVL